MSDSDLIPPALSIGDTIAFVSPSYRFNDVWSTSLARAKRHLEGLGFKVIVIYNSHLQGSFKERVRERCDELHKAFKDPEVKAILCTIGGEGANELIRHLDYDLIRANPKIFCGFSDTTILHCAILTQAGLRTFYGPSALGEFGEYPSPLPFTSDHFLRVLHHAPGEPIGSLPRSQQWATELPDYAADDSSQVPRQLSPSPAWKWIRPGKARGRILGGVITSFLQLPGTKFWPDLQGAILLIETSFGGKIGKPVPLAKTRKQLVDLANTGAFDRVNGLLFGRPVGHNEQMEKELVQILLEDLAEWDFPILVNVDVGHTHPMLTVPLGAMAVMDSERDELKILDAAVK